MGFRKSNGGCLRSTIEWGNMSNPFQRLVERIAKWFGFGEHESDGFDSSEFLDIICAGLVGGAVGMNVSPVISVWTSTGRMDYEMFMSIVELGGVESGLFILAALILRIWSLNLRDSQPD